MTVEEENVKVVVNGFEIEFDAYRCLQTWNGVPVATFWTESSLAGLMLGFQRMVGADRFSLALQSGGRESIAADWAFLSSFPTFEEGFTRLGAGAASAGWGRWVILSFDKHLKKAKFRVENGWEGMYQRALGVCWGSSFLAGKFAGLCGRAFGVNCWARQTAFAANGDPADEFEVEPSGTTIESEIERMLGADQATRADLAVALERLKAELAERAGIEKTLRRAEERLRSYFQLDVVGVAFTRLDGEWIEFNDKLCELVGCSREEVVRSTLHEIFGSPEMGALLPAAVGDAISFDRWFLRADGERTDVSVAIQRLAGGGTEGEHIVVVLHDITERTRVERDLRAKVELIERQKEVIRELAVPVIQVWDGVLTVPLTGVFDSGRSADVMDKLLNEVIRVQAKFVLLDLTGVEVVDSATANRFLMLAGALKLLGVSGILTGIRPSVAQTLVSLGVDLASIRTFSTLRDGLRFCMRGEKR